MQLNFLTRYHTLTSYLSTEEVITRVKEHVGSYPYMAKNSKPYKGTVSAESFEITRIIKTNGMITIISGTVTGNGTNTVVDMKIQVPKNIYVMLFFFFAITIAYITWLLHTYPDNIVGAVIVAMMNATQTLLIKMAFNGECKRLITYWEDILHHRNRN